MTTILPRYYAATRRSTLLWALGATTLLAAIASVEQVLQLRAVGRLDPLSRTLLQQFPYWLMWGLLAPLIGWLVSWLRARKVGALTATAVHALAAALLMLLHSGALYAWQVAFHLTDLYIPIWQGAFAVSYWRLIMNLLVYGAILGLTSFLDAARRERQHELSVARLGTELADARLRALRMQLNPHFLFNSLNTVSMLVRQEEGAAAVRVVTALSDLLRHVLRDSHEATVTLGEELALLERYLSVERARFGAALRTEISAEPDTLQARVPNLILQPIVENAFRHGIARRPGAGSLAVFARRNGSDLLIEVRDDGAGLRAADNGQRQGLGLANTVQRLSGLYGNAFDFELSNGEVGAVARLRIPYVPARGVA